LFSDYILALYRMNNKIIWKETQIKTRISNKYYNIIEAFFQRLEKINTDYKDINIKTCMCLGLNTIYRVFEYVLIKTKNVEKAYYYAQKTYIYYIEYMEQIYETNLQNNLNHGDAILFIYKKTIFEIQNGEDNKLFDTITNIMTFDEEITNMNQGVYKNWLYKLKNLTHIFFYWSNENISFNERVVLSKDILKQYINNLDSVDDIVSYIEMIQEKVYLNYETYKDLLQELIEHHIQQKKRNNLVHIEQNDMFLKIHIEQNILHERVENGNMKELIKWLYKPIIN